MENQDALVSIFARNSFYKHMHYLMLVIWILTLFVVGALFSMIFYLVEYPTTPIFFATDPDGRLINILPLDVPNMSDDAAGQWAIDAVQAAYSYDYVNYRQQLQSAQKYFTAYGWSGYIKSIAANNNLLALTQRRLVVIAQAIDKPKILAKGLLRGAYTWRFQLPVLVTYLLPPYDEKSRFYNPQQVTVTVQQQPVLQSYGGLGIVNFIGEIVSNSNQTPEISSTPTPAS